MRFIGRVALILTLASGLAVAARNVLREPHTLEIQDAKSVDDFRDLAIQALEYKQAKSDRRGQASTCTIANARIRRDWYA